MTKQAGTYSISVQDLCEKVTQPFLVLSRSLYGQQNQVQMPQPGIQGPVNASNFGFPASQSSAVSICKLTVNKALCHVEVAKIQGRHGYKSHNCKISPLK